MELKQSGKQTNHQQGVMAIMNQLTYITLWYSTLQLIDGHYINDRILQVFPVQISFHQTIWNILIPHQFNKQLTSRCVAIYHYFQMPSMTRQCYLYTTRERWREAFVFRSYHDFWRTLPYNPSIKANIHPLSLSV